MFAIERQQAILNYIKEKKSITVKELSKKFYIGEATIRRDLEKLENTSMIKRTYGGAILKVGLDIEVPLSIRESERKLEKDSIARLASELVNSGDTIIMDSSSTVMQMIEHIKMKTDLTVITNGAKTATRLAEHTKFKLFSTGGRMREETLTYYGETANAFIKRFNADVVFLSCGALSMDKGITDSNEEEESLRCLMIESANRSVLLCDYTKFNKTSFCKICDISDVDIIITDQKPSDMWIEYARQMNTELIY